MCDSAGQGADALQALGAQELFFELSFISNIRADAQNRFWLSGLVAYQ